MRLYLSSSSLGNQPQALLPLLENGKRVAVIANALDYFDRRTRAAGVASEVEQLRRLGLDTHEIDLRHYFGKSQLLAQTLAPFHLLWVRGGNLFVLRRACQQSGFDTLLQQLLAQDAIAYGGNSAGSCLLTPSLHGVELVDDPAELPKGYNPAVIWEGLGILPYYIVPHYQSTPPEFAAAIDQVIAYYTAQHIPFKILRDGQVLIIQGNQEHIIS